MADPRPLPLPPPIERFHGRSASLERVELLTYPRRLHVRFHFWYGEPTYPCDVTFTGVHAFELLELDYSEFYGRASFVEIPDSPWLAACKAMDHARKIGPDHRHLVLRTYDEVLEVLCSGYALTLGAPVYPPPDEPDEPEPA
ncbi:MAG: hypothetical protein R3B09_01330 [Nannocystaceae bacterium]